MDAAGNGGTTMKHVQRLDMKTVAPKTFEAVRELGKTNADAGLDAGLCEMLKIRASQINGCVFCLDMHVQVARKLGVSEDRMHMIAVWRESPLFDDAESVAFELTEAVTLISQGGVSDDLYQRVRQHYNEVQYLGLLTTINTINIWNRFMIAVGTLPPQR